MSFFLSTEACFSYCIKLYVVEENSSSDLEVHTDENVDYYKVKVELVSFEIFI
jgi:hypothetical protein